MAGKPRITDPDVAALESVSKMAREQADVEIAELKSKQEMIAKSYEMAGQIKAVRMMSKFGDVTSLMWLKQVKESKIYRDLPNIGTWENYCEYIGLDRHTVDQNLLNLATFGEEFLAAVTSLQVGYRDLRKLRQLTHDGTVTIDAEAVVIGDDRIPLDQDHREDLQAAIEKIIDEQAAVKAELNAQKKAFDRVQDDTRKSMTRLQKELDRFTAQAEAKGLSSDEDAFMQRLETHRTMVQGSLIALEPEEIAKEFDNLTPRMRARVIATAHELKMQALALYDTVITEIGNGILNPELIDDYGKWAKENGFD